MMKPLRRQHWRHHCSINWFDFAIRNQDRRNLPENNIFVFSKAAKSEDYFVVMMDQSLAAYFNRQSYQLKNVVYELMRISSIAKS